MTKAYYTQGRVNKGLLYTAAGRIRLITDAYLLGAG